MSRYFSAVVFLTIVAGALRTWFLTSKSLWLDEGITAYVVSLALPSLVKKTLVNDSNMTFYYLLLRGWTQVTGLSEVSLRMPSVIFATATVPILYAFGKELYDRKVALLAALLLSVNAGCIEYAQQARSYAMVTMLVTLSALLFIRSLKRSSRGRRASYVIAGTLCAYAHLFGALILPAQFLAVFLFPTENKTKSRIAICVFLVAILSLPAFALAILRDHGQVGWITPPTIKKVIHVFAKLSGVFSGQFHPTGLLLFGAYLAAIATALLRAPKPERSSIFFLLSAVVLPVLIALIVSIRKPIFVDRYLLVCVPFYVLLAAAGVMRIQSRVLLGAIALFMVSLNLVQDRFYYENDGMQDWRGAVDLVAHQGQAGDLLVIFPGDNARVIEFYIVRLEGRPMFNVVVTSPHELDEAVVTLDPRADALKRFLEWNDIDSFTRVWFLTDGQHGKPAALRTLFSGHRVKIFSHIQGVFLARVQ